VPSFTKIYKLWQKGKYLGYEISFNKYFYRHKPLRSIEAVTADILQLEAESDGLIREILGYTDQ
jgi:hypothetical protein